MAQNLSNYDSLLKVVYSPKAKDWLNHSTVLLDTLKRKTDTTDVVGKTFTIAVIDNYNQAIGSIAETGTLPTARNVSSRTTVVPMKYHVGSIQVSKVLMEASRNNTGAFAKAISLEMDYMLRGMSKDINRQLFGDGSGALAYSTAADDASPWTVDDNAGNNFHHVKKDMLLDVLDANNSYMILNLTDTAGIRITSTTASTITATGGVDGLSGTADGDLWVRRDSNNATTAAAPTAWYEMMGLRGIVDTGNPPTGNLQGIDRTGAGNEQWQAGGGSGEIAVNDDINEDYIQQGLDVLEQYGKCKLILTSRGIRRKFFAHLVADRRFVDPNGKFAGGFNALYWNNIPIVVDDDCDKKTMYLLDTDVLSIYQLADVDWLDDDGNVLHRTGTTMAYDATMIWYIELGVFDCQPLVKLTGITE